LSDDIYTIGESIAIFGCIDDKMALNVCSLLDDHLELERDKAEPKSIKIVISSYGGEMPSMLAIINKMRELQECGICVATEIVGCAYSAAMFVAAAGTTCLRTAKPNSLMMIHAPSAYIGWVTADQYDVEKDRVVYWTDVIINLLSSISGKTKKEVREDLERDLYLTPDAAMGYGKHGLIDEVA